ncbi:hypothetical protein QTP70_030803, partial [Hemibagrus guttatus]
MKKKRAEKRRHVVAWMNKAEWEQVVDHLHSREPALQTHALHRITAWKGRFGPSTPVAVESTANLVRCQILDRSRKLERDDLVLLYGMALTRFVNLILERKQGCVAKPLRRLASTMNIPEWIVNLRHEITHRRLPTLKWCRKGCEFVLKWLQQQYWSRQLSGLSDWNSSSEAEEDEEESTGRQEEEVMKRRREIERHKRARELIISYEQEQFQERQTGQAYRRDRQTDRSDVQERPTDRQVRLTGEARVNRAVELDGQTDRVNRAVELDGQTDRVNRAVELDGQTDRVNRAVELDGQTDRVNRAVELDGQTDRVNRAVELDGQTDRVNRAVELDGQTDRVNRAVELDGQTDRMRQTESGQVNRLNKGVELVRQTDRVRVLSQTDRVSGGTSGGQTDRAVELDGQTDRVNKAVELDGQTDRVNKAVELDGQTDRVNRAVELDGQTDRVNRAVELDGQTDRVNRAVELDGQTDRVNRAVELDGQTDRNAAVMKLVSMVFEDLLKQGSARGSWPNASADLSWILAQIQQLNSEASDAVINTLVQDGFLIPTSQQLDSLNIDPSEDLLDPLAPCVPPEFLRFWLPLLKVLNSSSFINQLLEKLFTELATEPTNHRAYYTSAWISEILHCNGRNELKAFRRMRMMKERLFINRIPLRWHELISVCVNAPCAATPFLLQQILMDMDKPLPLDTQQNLLRLCTIYTQSHLGSCSPSNPDSSHPVYTLESLQERVGGANKSLHEARELPMAPPTQEVQEQLSAETVQERNAALRGSAWSVCTDKVPWKQYPLGKVPGQMNDPSCLMVETYCTLTVFDQQVKGHSHYGNQSECFVRHRTKHTAARRRHATRLQCSGPLGRPATPQEAKPERNTFTSQQSMTPGSSESVLRK